MKKVLAIVGPTGAGKTSLGIQLAQKFGGEIISGDSIQVYKELNIGSAKVGEEEQKQAKHHLIDILTLNQSYNVADFQIQARSLIDQLSEENKLPIIVGGTGLYIKSCLYDYQFPKQTEREDNTEFENLSNETLYAMLQEADYPQSLKIHVNNRKRLIRALQMAKSGNRRSDVLSDQTHEMIYDAKLIGLTMPREILYERINTRVDKMMEAGLLEEMENLVEKYPDLFDKRGMQGIGYREWKGYFENEKTLEEVLDEIRTHSRQFAKRQYTWFNNQMAIDWFDICEPNSFVRIEEEVTKWL